jgi:hypothetical protein
MSPAATPAVAPATDPANDWRPALAALERGLRQELAQGRQTSAPTAVPVRVEEPADRVVLMRQVQALVNASESRQRDEMALRLAQTYRDWDMQRRGDIVRIEQRIGTLQGRTFKAEAGQQEVMNLLRRVSAQPIP